MAASCFESWEGRDSTESVDASSIDLKFFVLDTDDDAVARTLINATAPSAIYGLGKLTVQMTRVGQILWEATVHYGTPDEQAPPPDTGESLYSFDTGGGTTHITQSKSTVNSYARSGATAPDFKGAIGVSGEAGQQKVDGVDISIPALTFSRTHYLPDAMVNLNYVKFLARTTAKMNNQLWYGFAAGELLFLGASGTKRGRGDWEVEFKFSASENLTGLTLGAITGVAKLGWDYLWVYYQTEDDTTAKKLVQQPLAAYVERVYETADFTQLGIGF